MRAKTKHQIAMVKLNNQLPAVGRAHVKWASLNLFDHYIYRTKGTHYCLDCGHVWDVNPSKPKAEIERCPKCKHLLKPMDKPKMRSERAVDYFKILESFKGYQVVRYIHVVRHCRAGNRSETYLTEVVRIWIAPTGETTHFSVMRGMNMWGYNDGWSLCSPLDLRNPTDNHYINTKAQYPNPCIIPEIYRNGYHGETHTWNEAYFFSILMGHPIAETLYKSKQLGAFDIYCNDTQRFKKYWASVKIAMKHGIQFNKETSTTWFDHVSMLEKLGKDIHNPKFIAPRNLRQAHQRLIDKMRRIDAKKRLEQLRAEIEKANIIYQKDKANFFDLVISNGEIEIRVLDSVQKFYDEGVHFNHCVFSNEYYAKRDSLILTAMKGKDKLETIELSMRDFSVMQAYGKNNKATKHHSAILRLISSNVKQLKQRKRKLVA